MMYIFYVAKW